jgi:hypothetical protein
MKECCINVFILSLITAKASLFSSSQPFKFIRQERLVPPKWKKSRGGFGNWNDGFNNRNINQYISEHLERLIRIQNHFLFSFFMCFFLLFVQFATNFSFVLSKARRFACTSLYTGEYRIKLTSHLKEYLTQMIMELATNESWIMIRKRWRISSKWISIDALSCALFNLSFSWNDTDNQSISEGSIYTFRIFTDRTWNS